MKPTLQRFLIPCLTAAILVLAGLVPTLHAANTSFASPAITLPALYAAGPTEADLKAALPGKTLIRVESGEFQRLVSTHSSQGRLITGPALAALRAGRPAASGGPVLYAAASPARTSRSARPCAQADSLLRERCLDSLARASGTPASADPDTAPPQGPKALREIEEKRQGKAPKAEERVRDTVYLGPDGEEVDKPGHASEDMTDEVQEERTRGYFTQFFFDLGRDGDGGGGGSWDAGDWAVVLYVVIGVVVVGAFLIAGGKAIYDLATNKDDAPIFKEVGARFSYSGLTMYDHRGASLYRDAYLAGLRFAFGVQKKVMSLGLAVEGGSINLSVRGLDVPQESLDFRGGYLVGGPMVRFGNYHPLALTLEFLNGTSNHKSIGWISKSRMMLAAKAGEGFLIGAHLGGVFYDLRFHDGLVFRKGDLNRDLSLVVGLDAGWAF